jgi:hypothetical protein
VSEVEKFSFDGWALDLAKVQENNESPKPFKHVYSFVKNNQSMTRYDFKASYMSICDMLDQKSVNYAILMYAAGTYVFTEETIDFNPVIVKLTTGINFQGEITQYITGLGLVNSKLGR